MNHVLRSTTINLESGASSTDAMAIGTDKQYLEWAGNMSQGDVAVILGDCGEETEPPTRPMVFAVGGKVIWAQFTDAPCECPE